MSPVRTCLFVFILTVVAITRGLAAELVVGEGGYDSIAAAVKASQSGDVLVLKAGTYEAVDVRLPHDLTLEGRGGVKLVAPNGVAKGLLVPLSGTAVTLRNIVFEGARSPDKNGAGVRFEGFTLLVENCTFRENENGILATGDKGGSVEVHASLFERNGHGDGYSHGIYLSHGKKLTVTGSVFLGTKVGHHIKSLAFETIVKSNRFDDGEGRTSYVVDVTKGGFVEIIDNDIIRRRSASQATLFNYDTSRGGTGGILSIEKNRFVTEKPRTRILRNAGDGIDLIYRNKEETRGAGSFRPKTGPPLPASSPIPSVNKGGGFLYGPRFDAAPEEAVARFALEKVGDGSPYVSFGQSFAKGAVPAGESLAAMVGDRVAPAQLDVKATHQDGSARHGVMTLRVPPKTGRRAQGHLLLGKVFEEGQAAPSLSSLNTIRVRVEGMLGEDEVTIHDVALGDLLKGAPVWLDGPLVTERLGKAPLGPLLTLRADMRMDAQGVGRVRLTFENHKTFSPLPRTLTYSVTVSDGDRSLFTETIKGHYRNSGWTLLLPVGGEPAYRVLHDPAGLIAHHALPPLAVDQPIAARSIARDGAPVRPGTHAPLIPYMPTSGGRYEIGPVTGWAAAWALSQDKDAKAAMLRAADIGLTIPWHFADDEKGVPIRVDRRHTDFWADPRGGDGMAALFENAAGGWTVDLPHRPGLAYPAYLATGEAVYARALAHEAAFAVSGLWPELRRERGLVTHAYQLRTTAWSLRTIGNAAWILPDDDPLKDYFVRLLSNNLSDLGPGTNEMAKRQNREVPLGYFLDHRGRDPLAIKPWQQDFMAMILAQEAARGHSRARRRLRWMTPYMVGRVLAPGADTSFAAAPLHMVLTEEGDPLATWDAIMAATRATKMDPVYTGAADGGYGTYRAALAAMNRVSFDTRIDEALTKLQNAPQAEKIDDAQNRLGRAWVPQFAFEEGARSGP